MKKYVLTLLLTVVALASFFAINPSHASITPAINIDSATQQFPSAQVGDNIQVNITISNVQNLWAWDIADLKFNPAILNLTQVSEGPFLAQSGQTAFLWTSTSSIALSKGDIPDIADALLTSTGSSGNGVLATLTFKVLSVGTCPITFNQTTLLDTTQISANNPVPMASVANNANIIVGTSTGSTPTPTSTTTATPTSAISSSTPTSSTSPTQSSNTSTTTPSSSNDPANAVPEFPITTVLAILIIAITASVMVIARNNTRRKQ